LVRVLLAIKRSWVGLPAATLLGGDLEQVDHPTRAPSASEVLPFVFLYNDQQTSSWSITLIIIIIRKKTGHSFLAG